MDRGVVFLMAKALAPNLFGAKKHVRKQGGRFISIAIHKYLSTSKTGMHTASSFL